MAFKSRVNFLTSFIQNVSLFFGNGCVRTSLSLCVCVYVCVLFTLFKRHKTSQHQSMVGPLKKKQMPHKWLYNRETCDSSSLFSEFLHKDVLQFYFLFIFFSVFFVFLFGKTPEQSCWCFFFLSLNDNNCNIVFLFSQHPNKWEI